MRLKRLARNAARPPLATERLSRLPDGRLLYRLKRRWRDGTSHVTFAPIELVEKLAALVPPPRFNRVRYHGVLAPSAAWRALVIPESETCDSPIHRDCPARPLLSSSAANAKKKGKCRPRNYSWAEFLKRIFELDILKCPRFGGRMRILAAIHPPEGIRKILECLGLPSRPPPLASATSATADPYSFWIGAHPHRLPVVRQNPLSCGIFLSHDRIQGQEDGPS
jgi:hypothetical protein